MRALLTFNDEPPKSSSLLTPRWSKGDSNYQSHRERSGHGRARTNHGHHARSQGFIRQAAIGDPLVPYAERVEAAMRRMLAGRQWTEPQRRWLRRIGEQLEREIVVDREAVDHEPFRADGGFTRLNRGSRQRVTTMQRRSTISSVHWRLTISQNSLWPCEAANRSQIRAQIQ
jgi:hypothetical protein